MASQTVQLIDHEGITFEEFFNNRPEMEIRILRHCQRRLSNPSDAEDAAAETWIRAYQRWGLIKEEFSISTWIYRIADRVCTDKYRKTSKYEFLIDINPSDYRLEEREVSRIVVWAALLRIPEIKRLPIILVDLEDLSYQEAAEVLNISLNAVRQRLHEGRQILKSLIKSGEFPIKKKRPAKIKFMVVSNDQ